MNYARSYRRVSRAPNHDSVVLVRVDRPLVPHFAGVDDVGEEAKNRPQGHVKHRNRSHFFRLRIH